MYKALLSWCVSISLFAQTAAPPVLNNQRIADLVATGVSTPEVLRIIATAPKIDFDLRPASTDALMKAGVSEDLIKAMAAREIGSAQITAPPVRASSAEQQQAPPPQVVAPPPVPFLPPAANGPDGRRRIFVGETAEWQVSSFNIAHSAASYNAFSGSAAAGAFGMSHAGWVKLTVSVMNQISEHCTGVVIVNRPELADLFVRLDQSSTMWARHDDMAVFNRSGEMTFVTSTHSLSKDVKRFCKGLMATVP